MAMKSQRKCETARKHPALDGADRQGQIALIAYYKSERRGFAPGFEMEDWLEAEREYETVIAAAAIAVPGDGSARQPAKTSGPRQRATRRKTARSARM